VQVLRQGLTQIAGILCPERALSLCTGADLALNCGIARQKAANLEGLFPLLGYTQGGSGRGWGMESMKRGFSQSGKLGTVGRDGSLPPKSGSVRGL
jgi:hypothetical protein